MRKVCEVSGGCEVCEVSGGCEVCEVCEVCGWVSEDNDIPKLTMLAHTLIMKSLSSTSILELLPPSLPSSLPYLHP